MRFLPLREGRLSTMSLGAKGFALHTLRETLALLEKQQGCSARRFPGLYASSAGFVCPFAAAPTGDFVFNMGEHSPARKAGMTETHQQVDGASQYWRFSHSRFFVLPKRRKALRINQKTKGDRT